MSTGLRPLRVDEFRCFYCERIGTRGFLNKYGDYRLSYGYYCESRRACERRGHVAGLLAEVAS